MQPSHFVFSFPFLAPYPPLHPSSIPLSHLPTPFSPCPSLRPSPIPHSALLSFLPSSAHPSLQLSLSCPFNISELFFCLVRLCDIRWAVWTYPSEAGANRYPYWSSWWVWIPRFMYRNWRCRWNLEADFWDQVLYTSSAVFCSVCD